MQPWITPEERHRSLFDEHPDAIFEFDLEGRFRTGNAALERLMGHAVHDLVGRPFHGLIVPEDLAHVQAMFDKAVGGKTVTYVTRAIRVDGEVREARVTNIPLVVDGTVVGVHGVARDVTDELATERALERERFLLRMAGAVARFGGWEYDLMRDSLAWSSEIHELLEYPVDRTPSPEEAALLYPPDSRERAEAAFDMCCRHGRSFDLELQMNTATGRRIWVRAVGESVRDEEGQVVLVRGAFQDVTQRKHAEQENREIAERLTATFMSITDAVATVDGDWRFTYLNQRAAELLRRDRDELLGSTIWAELPHLCGGPVERTLRRVSRTGASESLDEVYYAPLNGWVEAHVYPFDGGLTVYFRDVSERREARQELRRREARMRELAELLDKASDAIIVRDADDRITYWNRSATTLYGWDREEVVGRRIRDVLSADGLAFDRATSEVWAQGEWSGELEQQTRDGREITVQGRWTLVRDDDDTPRSIMAINTDVTDRRRMEHLLLRSQRMESLGTLAGGMAHDLNNALSPILMATQLLAAAEDDPDRRSLIEMVAESARHGADLVGQVLAFARGVDGRRERVDVAGVVQEVDRIVRDTFPANIRWRGEITPRLWPVEGDPTQLRQVLVNLCVNARDAMPRGGDLLLKANNVVVRELPVDAPETAAPGPHVRLQVVDTGTGMPPEVLDRAFEPFYTTKAHGHGTGLGLSTSLGIIHSHDGFLQVESRAGVGTTFVVHLPASHEAVATDPERTPSAHHGSGERILVVEDQPGVRHSTARALRANGYEVLVAPDGETALQLFGAHGETIDLVLSDMMMPGIDGIETLRRIWEVRADVPAIVTSGLIEQAQKAAGVLDVHFLPKPYDTWALLDAVATVIGPFRSDEHA